jgi:hypothetical protein
MRKREMPKKKIFFPGQETFLPEVGKNEFHYSIFDGREKGGWECPGDIKKRG